MNDLLKKKTPWTGILAIASCVRKGVWRKEVEEMLLEMQLMTQDDLLKERDKVVKMLQKCKKNF